MARTRSGKSSPIEGDMKALNPLLRLRSSKDLVAQVGNTRQQSDIVMVFVPDNASCMAFCSVLLGSRESRAGAGLFSSAFVRLPVGGQSEKKDSWCEGIGRRVGASSGVISCGKAGFALWMEGCLHGGRTVLR